jgi:NTE family protein
MAYLAMRDSNLPVPLADLVPRESVAGYRTDFAPMSPDTLTLLATRGEQLTRALLPYYCPGLT